jgi:hypothetical protein
MRMDDNGSVVVMASVGAEDVARAMVHVMEARGHKQTYWVEAERDGDGRRPPPAAPPLAPRTDAPLA